MRSDDGLKAGGRTDLERLVDLAIQLRGADEQEKISVHYFCKAKDLRLFSTFLTSDRRKKGRNQYGV